MTVTRQWGTSGPLKMEALRGAALALLPTLPVTAPSSSVHRYRSAFGDHDSGVKLVRDHWHWHFCRAPQVQEGCRQYHAAGLIPTEFSSLHYTYDLPLPPQTA